MCFTDLSRYLLDLSLRSLIITNLLIQTLKSSLSPQLPATILSSFYCIEKKDPCRPFLAYCSNLDEYEVNVCVKVIINKKEVSHISHFLFIKS